MAGNSRNQNTSYVEERGGKVGLNSHIILPDNVLGAVTGPPYAGKNRTLNLLMDIWGIRWFEVSKALKKSSVYSQAQVYMDSGDLVPDEFTAIAVREEIAREELTGGVIVVGFPRNEQQAGVVTGLQLPVFLIDTPIEVCVSRAKARLAELAKNPAARDADRGDRTDETPETIQHRFGVWCMQTIPGIERVKNAGLLRPVAGEATERAQSIADTLGLKRVGGPQLEFAGK